MKALGKSLTNYYVLFACGVWCATHYFAAHAGYDVLVERDLTYEMFRKELRGVDIPEDCKKALGLQAVLVKGIGKKSGWFEKPYISDINSIASNCQHMPASWMAHLVNDLKRENGLLVSGKEIFFLINGQSLTNIHFNPLTEEQINHALKICSERDRDESVQILQRELLAHKKLLIQAVKK